MRKGILILIAAAAVGAVLLAALSGEPELDPLADGTKALAPVPPAPDLPDLPDAQVVPLPEGAEPSLAGTVLSAEERPVARARVEVYRLDGVKVVEPPFALRTTDGAGQFAVLDAPAGAYAIDARAPGHGPALFILREYDEEKGAHVLLRLTPAAYLAGRVVTERGEPLAGAKVFVRAGQVISKFGKGGLLGRLIGGGGARATADAAGDFRIDDVPPGIYDLTAKAEGMVPTTVYSVRAPDDRITVALREGITIRGVLRWGEEDAPADIRLRVEPLDPRVEVKSEEEEAAFAFDPLPPDHYRVSVWAAGFREVEAQIELVRGEVPKPIEIDLVPGAELVVEVTDADWGTPLRGAKVVLSEVTVRQQARNVLDLQEAVTNEEGVATLRVAPGTWTLRAELPGWMSVSGSGGSMVVSDNPIARKLALRKIYRIRGRVLDHDLRPVRAYAWTVRAELHPTRKSPEGVRAPPRVAGVRADENGRFTMVGIVPWGIYTVGASAGRDNNAEATDVALADGARVVDVGDLLVAPPVADPLAGNPGGEPVPLGKVRGRILDDHGRPFRGAVVTARDRAAHSSVDGTFLLDDLRKGWITIRIAARGFAPTVLEKFELREGEDYYVGDVHLPLHGVMVLGRVLDRTRAPIPGARVRVRFGGITEPFDTVTATDGTYEMEGPAVSLVSVQVTAEAAGFVPRTVRDTLAGERVVNVVLPRDASLTGQVSFRGEPASRLTVIYSTASESRAPPPKRRDVSLDGEGRFVLDRMPLGKLNIMLEAPGYAPLWMANRLFREGRAHDLGRIGLNRGGVITGQVLRKDGKPAPGFRVGLPVYGLEATAGKDGTFRLERVPVGSHTVLLRDPAGGRSRAAGKFTAEEGKVVKMNFRWFR